MVEVAPSVRDGGCHRPMHRGSAREADRFNAKPLGQLRKGHTLTAHKDQGGGQFDQRVGTGQAHKSGGKLFLRNREKGLDPIHFGPNGEIPALAYRIPGFHHIGLKEARAHQFAEHPVPLGPSPQSEHHGRFA